MDMNFLIALRREDRGVFAFETSAERRDVANDNDPRPEQSAPEIAS